VLLAVDETD